MKKLLATSFICSSLRVL